MVGVPMWASLLDDHDGAQSRAQRDDDATTHRRGASRPARRTGPFRGQDAAMRLTFDDGPDPRFTPLVLDALREFGATATFYCVGRRALAWPQLVRRIAAEGHTVGSHTMTHPDLSTLDPFAAIGDIRRGRRAVEAALGAPVPRFRAPFGRLGTPGKVALAVCRLEHDGWDVEPEDWRPDATAEAIAVAIRTAGADDVVLLHDGAERPIDPRSLDRSQTVGALRLLAGAPLPVDA
jgi:peptidoglycan/xylan/chitin deacetylase (PgdA/CDA1 family)